MELTHPLVKLMQVASKERIVRRISKKELGTLQPYLYRSRKQILKKHPELKESLAFECRHQKIDGDEENVDFIMQPELYDFKLSVPGLDKMLEALPNIEEQVVTQEEVNSLADRIRKEGVVIERKNEDSFHIEESAQDEVLGNMFPSTK